MKEVEITLVVRKRFPVGKTLGEIERELIHQGWEIIQVYKVKEV